MLINLAAMPSKKGYGEHIENFDDLKINFELSFIELLIIFFLIV